MSWNVYYDEIVKMIFFVWRGVGINWLLRDKKSETDVVLKINLGGIKYQFQRGILRASVGYILGL